MYFIRKMKEQIRKKNRILFNKRELLYVTANFLLYLILL